MASTTNPVEDTVPKINEEVAVGADIEFQRKWWRFERVVWVFFTLLVILDLLGVFGRGPLAKAHARANDGSISVTYERIERSSTPSICTVNFSAAAIHQGQVQLWVSESLVKKLGNQRIVPQPSTSVIDHGGILYTFPATRPPASVEFALAPASVGVADLQLRVPGFDSVTTKVFVMP